MAFHRFEPTQTQRDTVEVMIAGGIPYETIRQCIENPLTQKPVASMTFQKAFKPEIQRGGARATQRVVATMFKMATSGDSPASTMFWLKCREKWREVSRMELTGADGETLLATKEMYAREIAKMTDEEIDAILRAETNA